MLRGGRGRQNKKEGDQRGQMRDLRRCLGVEDEEEHRGRWKGTVYQLGS